MAIDIKTCRYVCNMCGSANLVYGNIYETNDKQHVERHIKCNKCKVEYTVTSSTKWVTSFIAFKGK